MKIIQAKKRTVLPLGRCGENLSREIIFDISSWEKLYGNGTVELLYQRPTDERPYIMEITRDGSMLHWYITSWHTAIDIGYGSCELRYYANNVLKKSRIWSTRVDSALDTPITEVPPNPEQGWVNQILEAAEQTKNRVAQTAGSAQQCETSAKRSEEAASKARVAAEQAENTSTLVHNAAIQSENYAELAETAALRAETAAVRAETATSEKKESYQFGTGLKLIDNTLEVDSAENFLGNNARPASVTLVQNISNKVDALANSTISMDQIVQQPGTSSEKVMSQKAVTAAISNYVLPDYWVEHLNKKIHDIKTLQDAGGKDCFSFIVMTDMHYPSNRGKYSPALARYIMDRCDIKYALCLGDVQTRGCHATKELLLDENANIETMLAPLRRTKSLLQTQGNHDGNYGTVDGENYVFRITPQELHGHIYRKVGLIDGIHFDESGTGYWTDDTALKVRYILLNTHNTVYAKNEDGTQKYPNMQQFRFQQSQYDMVVNALNTVPDDSWDVVIAGHVALGTNGGHSPWGDGTERNADCTLMNNLLAAYKNKQLFNGTFTGTATGEMVVVPAYTNLAEPLPNNTTDNTKWIKDYRISSSGIASEMGTTLSNPIYCSVGDVIRVKGVTFRSSKDRYGTWREDGVFFNSGYGYVSAGSTSCVGVEQESDGTYMFTVLKQSEASPTAYMRFAFQTPEDASAVIITKNEPITENTTTISGYDYVSVNTDFTNAKGNIVGFFGGHTHTDSNNTNSGINRITTRCDAAEENVAELKAERVAGSITEQSFDVFTVNKKTRKIHATKIGAGNDRDFMY